MRKKLPKRDEIRVVKRFAFLPTKTEGYKIWLEYYYTIEKYVTNVYNGIYFKDEWIEVHSEPLDGLGDEAQKERLYERFKKNNQ